MGSLSDNLDTLRRVAWGVVHNARRLGQVQTVGRPLWSLVMELTGQGSTSARELCREFEVDPDEIITGAAPGFVLLSIEQLDELLNDLAAEVNSDDGDAAGDVDMGYGCATAVAGVELAPIIERVKAKHGLGKEA